VPGERSNLVNVGRISGAFGVKGWIKIVSHTEPKENIVHYSPWKLKTRHGVKTFEVDEYKFQNQGIIVHFKGIDDRDSAAEFMRADIAIERWQMPPLEEGEFYWHELIGLAVIDESRGHSLRLGKIKDLVETGANDVLVVAPCEFSIDDKERLIPYVPELYVTSVDIEQKEIKVRWDPDF